MVKKNNWVHWTPTPPGAWYRTTALGFLARHDKPLHHREAGGRLKKKGKENVYESVKTGRDP